MSDFTGNHPVRNPGVKKLSRLDLEASIPPPPAPDHKIPRLPSIEPTSEELRKYGWSHEYIRATWGYDQKDFNGPRDPSKARKRRERKKIARLYRKLTSTWKTQEKLDNRIRFLK